MKYFIANIVLAVLLSNAFALASESTDNCAREKKIKAVSSYMSPPQWVQFEKLRVTLGGSGEEFQGPIDKDAIRRVMISCMSGTVRCLNNYDKENKSGQFLLTFDLQNPTAALFPKINNIKVDASSFKNKELQKCLADYWSDIRYPFIGTENNVAKVKEAFNVEFAVQ